MTAFIHSPAQPHAPLPRLAPCLESIYSCFIQSVTAYESALALLGEPGHVPHNTSHITQSACCNSQLACNNIRGGALT